MKDKTDNHDPAAKLKLRRFFLSRFHSDAPAHVLDCCQGDGLLWNSLFREFTVASYWGIDVKPKPGRVRLDSARVLAQPGWPQNVIDIDTYGSPWKHWEAMLPNVVRPVTVFLTIGQLTQGVVGSLGDLPLVYMGLGSLAKKLPSGFHSTWMLRTRCVPYALRRAVDFGINVIEAVEAVSTGSVRYIGVRLEPTISGAADSGESSP